MTQGWLTIIEYARRFQVSDMTVRRRIRSGRLPAQLRDGKYYIPVPSAGSYPGENTAHNPVVHPYVPPYGSAPSPPPSSPPPSFCAAPRHAPPPQRRDLHPALPPRELAPSYSEPAVPAQAPLAPQVVRDAQQLIRLCDELILQIKEKQRLSEQSFQLQVEKLERDISNLNLQLSAKKTHLHQLQEQVEDLQLLVKILDESRPPEAGRPLNGARIRS